MSVGIIMDRKAFYNALRPVVNLTTQNVFGCEKHLDYLIASKDFYTKPQASYIFATSWWESAQTMHPVKEAYWMSEAWRKKHLRYYPWYGRGLIQTTWEGNYKKVGDLIGVDLISNPDKLLTFECALPALFLGMEKGIYTGKDLNDFIDDVVDPDAKEVQEFINARKIVNGTDKAKEIARIGLIFEHAFTAAGYAS